MRILQILAFAIALPASLMAQQESDSLLDQINWQQGPSKGQLGYIAEVSIPRGYIFARGNDTRLLLEAMENHTNGAELGFLAPASFYNDPSTSWFVIFEFEEIGYVNDDEKDDLDADLILDSIRQATEENNKLARSRGWSTMQILGWEKKPFYNEQTNNVEWAPKGRSSDGELVVNYNSRLLGRKGVMSATLIVEPQRLAYVMPAFRQCIEGFSYKSGHKYSEWKAGDKVAEYGLIGLVTGGGIAVLAKSGWLAKFWKLLIIPFLAVGVFFKKLFGRK